MKLPQLFSKIIIALSLIGTANASYLTYIFLRKTALESAFGPLNSSLCDINSTFSCSNIVTSEYAQFLGVPVCTLALIVYPALIVLAFLAMKNTKSAPHYFYAISIISSMGFMLNAVYVYNEYVHLSAICVLCLVCLAIITTNLILSICGYKKSL